jgi:phosphoribosylglycinamide formyltransferase-1
MSKRRTAVLISGNGSNLQALIDDFSDAEHPGTLSLVLSNRAHAFGLTRATRANIPTVVTSHKGYTSREDYDAELVRILKEHQIEWVVLAGFMRILTPIFIEAFPNRIINIHPALLPSFRGLNGPAQAIEAGVKIAGASVHLVSPEMDAGPLLIQGAVHVRADDTVDSLKKRILAVEHLILPKAARWACGGRIALHEGGVSVNLPPGDTQSIFLNSL